MSIIQHKMELWSDYQYLHFKFMRMNELLNMRLFRLLSEISQKSTNEEMQNAYGDFVEQIRTVSSDNDYSTTYRILTTTRIEIASLETTPLYGLGEKCV